MNGLQHQENEAYGNVWQAVSGDAGCSRSIVS